MKKLALALLLSVPMMVHASGMGFYIPVSVGDTSNLTVSEDGLYADYDMTQNYASTAGIGLVFDSNIGKDKLFNYRVALEYQSTTVDSTEAAGSTEDCNTYHCEKIRLNFVQTFGFGVLRTETVRLWVGPRINMAWNSRSDSTDIGSGYTFTESEYALELGIAPAVGINVNLGRLVSLGADLDYRYAIASGAWDDFGSSGTYVGSTTGATARFYVMFRFGETFQPVAQTTAVDSSL